MTTKRYKATLKVPGFGTIPIGTYGGDEARSFARANALGHEVFPAAFRRGVELPWDEHESLFGLGRLVLRWEHPLKDVHRAEDVVLTLTEEQ
jgi:hypothetical protein